MTSQSQAKDSQSQPAPALHPHLTCTGCGSSHGWPQLKSCLWLHPHQSLFYIVGLLSRLAIQRRHPFPKRDKSKTGQLLVAARNATSRFPPLSCSIASLLAANLSLVYFLVVINLYFSELVSPPSTELNCAEKHPTANADWPSLRFSQPQFT